MKKSDWLILLMGFKGEGDSPTLDPIRVQKGMFLLAEEGHLPASERYQFEPHMWGPYSRELRRDLDRLVSEGYVQTRDVPGYSWKRYGLTEGGLDYARHMLQEADSATAHRVAHTKARITGHSFTALLQDVYSAHPEYAVNSLFSFVTVVVAVKCAKAWFSPRTAKEQRRSPATSPSRSLRRRSFASASTLSTAAREGRGRDGGSTRRSRHRRRSYRPRSRRLRWRRSFGAVNPLQKEVKDEWVGLPDTQPSAWGGIFCGWSNAGPWIFEIDVGGASQFLDPIGSTGSGYALAHVALAGVAHYEVARQSLEGAKAIAYRAIESTCRVSAYGVGMPVQLAVVTEAGVLEFYDGDQAHAELSDLVDLWKAKEAETLGQLAPMTTADEAVTDSDAEPSIEAEIGRADDFAEPSASETAI